MGRSKDGALPASEPEPEAAEAGRAFDPTATPMAAALGEPRPAAAPRSVGEGEARLRTLVDVLHRVLAEMTIDGLLGRVSEAACDLTGAGLGCAGYGISDGSFRVCGAARNGRALPDTPASMFRIERGGVYLTVIEQGRPLRLTDEALRRHPAWWGLPPGHPPLRGFLGVPLLGGDRRPAGLVMVSDRGAGDFTEDDEAVLIQLGLFASLALQHLEARAEIKAASENKDAFLAMLSHELRNPLAPIRNGLHVLRHAAPASEQARRAHAIVDRQAGHLTRLVDDLLDSTRISRGKIVLRREPCELGALLARTAEDHRSLLEGDGLRLDVRLCAGPVTVDGDPTRLSQVVGNLLHNAAKFSEPGGEVTLSLERDQAAGRAVLRIRDRGIGIDPELLPQLFEPFSQARSSLDRRRGGLGLGLALVRGLIELHGGEVAAHSDGPGRGAELVVRLPLTDAPFEARTEAPDARAPGPGRRLLIIEDNVDAADTLRELLELSGHRVEVAYDGPSGLQRARESRPELVLCDVGLPGMDGYAVARVLASELPEAVLVALTGYARPEDQAAALEAGFHHHLAKPPSLERLETLLGR